MEVVGSGSSSAEALLGVGQPTTGMLTSAVAASAGYWSALVAPEARSGRRGRRLQSRCLRIGRRFEVEVEVGVVFAFLDIP